MEPGERAAVLRLAGAWSRRLSDLDLPVSVVGTAAAGSPLAGLDLSLTGTTPQVSFQSGELAVVDLPDLTVRVRSTPSEAHGLLRAALTYRRVTAPQDVTYPADALPAGLAPRLVVVERSGRWYLSVLATLLGPRTTEANPPDVEAPAPVSSASPQQAVEATVRAFFDALASRDATPFARTLDASGGELSQLWTSEVAAPAIGVGERLEALRTTAGPQDDGRATVRVDELRVSGTSPLDLAGGCAASGSTRACLSPSGYRYAGGLGSFGLLDLLGRDGSFSLTAVRDADGWRTSLGESLADGLIGYADGLSRAQVLMLLNQERQDSPSGLLLPDRAEDVRFTDGGYVICTLRIDTAGLFRVVPSPNGSNRASVYDPDGEPAIQPFFPNDSVYRLAAGDHTLLVWADDAFGATLQRPGSAPYVQRIEVRSVR